MLTINGNNVANKNPHVSLTQEQYDNLTDEQKNDGTTYYIIGSNEETQHELNEILEILGSNEILLKYADETIIGVLKELQLRLGGLTFTPDETEKYIKGTYDDSIPENEVPELPEDPTDEEKLEYIRQLIGDPIELRDLGYSDIATAIHDLYTRLHDFSFNYNAETNTAEIYTTTE